MMKRLLVIASIFLLGARADSQKPAYIGNPDIDVLSYSVSADFQGTADTVIPFRAQIEIKAVADINVIKLDYEPSAISIEQVVEDKTDLTFNSAPGVSNKHGLTGTTLDIELGRVLRTGEVVTLDITYKVNVLEGKNYGLYRLPADKNFGREVILTRNWPYYGRFWLPSNDSPDDEANIRYSVTVPSNLTVLANGQILDDAKQCPASSATSKTCIWELRASTTTYNFVFAVGEYDVWKSELCFNLDGKIDNKTVDCAVAGVKIPVVVYFNKLNPDSVKAIDQIKVDVLSVIYFSKLFGRYAFDKVGFLLSPYEFSMESTGMIVLRSVRSTVHEIVHHWWGNNVHIAHWGDFWISEGFTTYFTGFYDEFLTGKNTATLENPPENLNHPPMTDPNDIFTSTPYNKGAMAIHSLRLDLVKASGGDQRANEVFVSLMRMLFTDYEQSRLSTEQLISFVNLHAADAFKINSLPVPADLASVLNLWATNWFVDIDQEPMGLKACPH